MRKHITYSYDKYEGHSNEKITELVNALNDCLAEQRRIEKEIKEIQDNCVHEYLFEASGMYEDTYSCKHCGHTRQK